MFTGLVRERGRLAEDPEPSLHGGVRLVFEHSATLSRSLSIGASVAVSGVCLTATAVAAGRTEVELSPETLDRTTLGGLRRGDTVNLEPPLRMGDPLGGHWVQGHVDGTVEVVESRSLGDHRELAVALPPALEGWVVEKGSVALDGVSLTVAARAPGRFTVALIPHTLEVTNLGERRPGDRLNLEVDVLAKYVHAALAAAGRIPG